MKRMLLGVGNRLSRDDGVGPAIACELVGSDWIAVDCGTAIENVAGWVLRERPDLLAIVDAAVMGLPPGSVRRLPLGCHNHMLASTHGLPLSFVLDRIEPTAGRIVLIGVEPEDLSWGEGLSESVAAAASSLIAELRGATDLETIPLHEDGASSSSPDRPAGGKPNESKL